MQSDKLEQKSNTTFEDLNWKKIYTNPIIATNDMKIRYTCLKRIKPLNIFLHKFELVSLSSCDVRQMDIKTVNHMVWECKYVQTFGCNLKIVSTRTE